MTANEPTTDESVLVQETAKLEHKFCLNCGKVLIDDYCHGCGQAADVERYSLRNVFHEAYKNLRKIELTATARTFWQLVVRPGEFVGDYLAGKRVRFVHPIKFMVYGYLLEILVRTFLASATGDAELSVMRGQGLLFQFIDLIAIAFWGLMWPIFYRAEELNVAEFALSAVFLHSETIFLFVALLIVTLPIRELVPGSPPYLTAVRMLFEAAYKYYFALQLFSHEPKWQVVLKQTVLYLLLVLISIPRSYLDEYIK